MNHEPYHRSLSNVLREEEIEVVPQKGVCNILSDAFDTDMRACDQLHEEFMDEFQVIPIRIQEGYFHIESIIFDLVGEGKRTEENMRDHSETVLQRFRKIEDIPITSSANRDQLLDGFITNANLALVLFVFQVELCTTDAYLAP